MTNALNKFIEGFKEKEYNPSKLGHFISFFINQNIGLYVEKEKEKGKKIDEIKEVVIRLNVKDLKHLLWRIGFSNREKSHLIIQGDCGYYIGKGMFGGKIEVQGSCDAWLGMEMSGGTIEVKGDCGVNTGKRMSGGTLVIWGEVESFYPSALSPSNEGEIWHKGERIWPK